MDSLDSALIGLAGTLIGAVIAAIASIVAASYTSPRGLGAAGRSAIGGLVMLGASIGLVLSLFVIPRMGPPTPRPTPPPVIQTPSPTVTSPPAQTTPTLPPLSPTPAQPSTTPTATQLPPRVSTAAAPAVSLTGKWSGPMTWDAFPGLVLTYQMWLTQTGNKVEGTSRLDIPQADGTTWFADMKLNGTVDNSGLHFTEYSLVTSSPAEAEMLASGGTWCFKGGDIQYDGSQTPPTLGGTWATLGCGSGTVTLTQQ